MDPGLRRDDGEEIDPLAKRTLDEEMVLDDLIDDHRVGIGGVGVSAGQVVIVGKIVVRMVLALVEGHGAVLLPGQLGGTLVFGVGPLHIPEGHLGHLVGGAADGPGGVVGYGVSFSAGDDLGDVGSLVMKRGRGTGLGPDGR